MAARPLAGCGCLLLLVAFVFSGAIVQLLSSVLGAGAHLAQYGLGATILLGCGFGIVNAARNFVLVLIAAHRTVRD